LDALKPGIWHGNDDEVGDDENVDEEQDEKLAVPEPDTIVNPRAVMVHVQHASVAGRAVMAALRLKYVAHEAVATAFVLWVTQVEAPENGDLARVGSHWLDEGPDKHDEQEVEEG